jgi:hypothetical protein
VAPGRTYFDIARFELQAEALLQAPVDVILSETESAAVLAGRPLAGPPP